MAGNTFGNILTLTSYGESHGDQIGGIIDGFPANFKINLEEVQKELDRRKPGQSKITTQRKEADTVVFHSGIFEGKTTGTPIGFTITNNNQKSKDYAHIKNDFRPSHADYTYQQKYGHRDYRGGGRSSARETACRVVAGALCKQWLSNKGIKVTAYVSSIGEISIDENYRNLDLSLVNSNPAKCPHPEKAQEMEDHILSVKKRGDTVGGVATAVISGIKVGLGEPVFQKLHAALGHAMLTINAVKGFEFGGGFEMCKGYGSHYNDEFQLKDKEVKTKSNYSGGIQGGISNGMDIYFNVGFKPVATIMQDQQSLNSDLDTVTVKGKGRHDPCVVPRAVPIVEAMAALVIMDYMLLSVRSG